MIATRLWLSRHKFEIIRKAARADGLTPSQFIAKASVDFAKAILERIERPKPAGCGFQAPLKPLRRCKPASRGRRRSISC
jgi:hypothetical protein